MSIVLLFYNKKYRLTQHLTHGTEQAATLGLAHSQAM